MRLSCRHCRCPQTLCSGGPNGPEAGRSEPAPAGSISAKGTLSTSAPDGRSSHPGADQSPHLSPASTLRREGRRDCEGHLRRGVPGTIQARCGDGGVRLSERRRGSSNVSVPENDSGKSKNTFRWDPTNSNLGAGDSDPVFHPYTTAEPHSPVGKSLRATFDGASCPAYSCWP